MVIIDQKKIDKKIIIRQAISVLKRGGIVVAPSDTVYGLLVDATNEEAVKKLISFKNRPVGKSISVFVSDFEMLNSQVEVNEKQSKILNTLLPGPYTIVLASKHTVSTLLESETGTLGVRFIDNAFISELISTFGKPTTATSANLAGTSSHYSVQSLLNQLPKSKQEAVDLIIDGGQLPRNKPSTVLDLTTPEVKTLREGDVSWKNKQTYETVSEVETKKIGFKILNESILSKIKDKSVVVIIKGDLGAGKTIFVKGIAEALNVDSIVSPTFTIYYEYSVKNSPIKNIYHYDLYNIEDAKEFNYLGIESYLLPGNVLFFEWGEKAAQIIDMLKEKSSIILVEIQYINENKRLIIIQNDLV